MPTKILLFKFENAVSGDTGPEILILLLKLFITELIKVLSFEFFRSLPACGLSPRTTIDIFF